MLVGFSHQTLACRYTVRDIGFAALRSHEYALVLSWEPLEDQRQSIRMAQLADEWSRKLKPLLAGSNVAVMIDQSRNLEHGKALSAAQHASAPSSQPESLPEQSMRMALVDRLGRALDLSPSLESLSEATDATAWLESHVLVPVLRTIGNEALESFAHLLVIESDDPQDNQRAHQVADQALAAIQRLEPLLPRPIAFPLRKLVLRSDAGHPKTVVRWMLGCDPQDAQALLAVVYGRGRLAGPAMQGDQLSLQEALAQLALVGQSCECETDRAWLDEPSLAFVWDASIRDRASSYLGFDPDSPLVRAEMLRIVSQGPKSNNSADRLEGTDSPDAIARLLLGYSESQLDGASGGQSQAERTQGASSVSQGDRLVRPAGVTATVIAGDGWDFDPPVANTRLAENNQASIDSVANDSGMQTLMLALSLLGLVGVSVVTFLILIVRGK